MNVLVEVAFRSPTAEDRASLHSVAKKLTNDPKSVRVTTRPDDPRWLVAEFTMPTEPQYSAVDKIDGQLRFWVENRMDSTIGFPSVVR